MELTKNQEKILDIITNNESCYSYFYDGNITTAITKAIEMSENYGDYITLTDEEFEDLKIFLMNEYNIAM